MNTCRLLAVAFPWLAMLAWIDSAKPATPSLPDWSGWWEFRGDVPSAALALRPPPLRPDDLRRLRAARLNPDLDPDALRHCRPPAFLGASGSVMANVEILFTPGRVTITNEAGLTRRIYTDGRSLPVDPDPSYTGFSVGRWEGDTLLVETVGLHPGVKFPESAPGAIAIGANVKIIERIRLRDAATLEFDVTMFAPEIFTQPYRWQIPFARSTQTAAREIATCSDFDRSIDPLTGRQRFDMTPPPDLPAPDLTDPAEERAHDGPER